MAEQAGHCAIGDTIVAEQGPHTLTNQNMVATVGQPGRRRVRSGTAGPARTAGEWHLIVQPNFSLQARSVHGTRKADTDAPLRWCCRSPQWRSDGGLAGALAGAVLLDIALWSEDGELVVAQVH